MDRLVDLDAAASEIDRRRPSWLASGLEPGPTTWRESAGSQPHTIVSDRDAVVDPDSVGIRVVARDRGEAQVVLFRGGWADCAVATYDQVGGPHVDAPNISSPEAFGAALDATVARLNERPS